MEFTEDQWAALKAWVEREARDWGGGLANRCGNICDEESKARQAFGLPPFSPTYAAELKLQQEIFRESYAAAGHGIARGLLQSIADKAMTHTSQDR